MANTVAGSVDRFANNTDKSFEILDRSSSENIKKSLEA